MLRWRRLILALLALSLYLPAFWWGAPHASGPGREHTWGVDDETPIGTIGKVHMALTGRPDPHPGYPLMYSLIMAASSAPYIAYLVATGGVRGLETEYPWGLRDPVGSIRMLSWLAHLMTVLLAVGVVIATYEAGRILWDGATGMTAALLMMTAFPMFYYSRSGNPDVPVLFFTALALIAYASTLRDGPRMRTVLLLGVFMGLAVATKEPSFASFLAIPAVLLWMHAREQGAGGWRTWSFWRLPLTGVVAAFLAYGLGSGLFLAPGWWIEHIRFASSRTAEAAAGSVAFVAGHPRTLAGNLALGGRMLEHLTAAMTVPGLALAVAGVGWVALREPKRLAFLLPALTYLAVLFWLARITQLRYMLPAVLTLVFFGGRALVLAWRAKPRAVRAAAVIVGAAVIGSGLLRGIDLTAAMLTDSRWAAGAWLSQQAQVGDRIEYFGPMSKLPPLAAGVVTERATEYHGAAVPARTGPGVEEEIRAGWVERRPQFIVIMPDHSSGRGQPHSATCPPAIYAELLSGALGYRLAAQFETPRLLPWVRRPDLDYPTVNPPIRIFVPVALEPGV